jgi:gamma-butyrobetaine dioxygenase
MICVGNDVHFTVSASSTNHAHSGHCPIDWLKEAAYSGNAIDKQRREAEPVSTTTLPTCDFTDIMTTDKGLYRWLKQINVYGVSLIQNMPAIPGQLEQMIEKRIGKIHTTIYGRTFDVVASETPINQAYTSDALQLHMDLVFYENMPGLQLLHCITNDVVEGGDSILLDAYPVVLEMRDKYPKQFDVLTKVPFTSERVHYKRDVPVDYKYSTPIIRLNNDGHIIAINWGPQIQSPLMINEHEVEDFYEAFTLLYSMFDRSDKKASIIQL